MRVYLDIENRQGELFIVGRDDVTAPGDTRFERPVAWAGDPEIAGRRLLVAKGTASDVPDAASLARAVDEGMATAAQLTRYGGLLFEAAFGPEDWQEVVQEVQREHATAHPHNLRHLPYLELAIRGGAADDQAALQALRWEALHDGTRMVSSQGTGPSGGTATSGNNGPVSVGVVRLVPRAVARGTATDPLVTRIPRVLFAVGGRLTDPELRPAAELMGIMRQLDCDGGSIHPRGLDRATMPALRDALRDFEPDVLHLTGHGRRLGGTQVAVQFRPEQGTPDAPDLADTWVTAQQLLGAFYDAQHIPSVVIVSACHTASAGQVNAAPFAAQLVAGGVPVVIAMAGEVTDAASRMFTRALTSAIGEGVPIAKAALRGRRAAFYQRPNFSSTHWVLPSVFLAEDLSPQARLADMSSTDAARRRAHRLDLALSPVFYGRNEFVDAMDQLLDGTNPLNVLLACTPNPNRSFGSDRLLRQLAARAVRQGVLPVLLSPLDQDPPKTRDKLAAEVSSALKKIRYALRLPVPDRTHLGAAARNPASTPADLAAAIRADLDALIADLPAVDPVRARLAGQPQVVLLLHRVDKWIYTLDDLLGMLGPMGLESGADPVPVVMTGADMDLKDTRLSKWKSGRAWIRSAPLDRFPTDDDEDLLAYLWWLLNPPKDTPVYLPLHRDDPTWRKVLRTALKDCIYDQDLLFTWVIAMDNLFDKQEIDHELLASFAQAAP
jgi:CHAT domain